MKVIDGKKEASWRDPMKDGKRIYGCPNCERAGKPIASHLIQVTASCEIEQNGKIKSNGFYGNGKCHSCGFEFGEVSGRITIDKVGLVE